MKGDFFRAVVSLDVKGFIKGTQEIDRGVYVAGETVGWGNVAYEMASRLPGFVRPNPSGGLAWFNGSNGPHGVVICWNKWSKIMAARELYRSIVPDCERKKEPWTTGAVARYLLRWVGDPMPYDKSVEKFLETHPYGYHECTPGLYLSTEKKWLYRPKKDLFDDVVPIPNPAYKPAVTLYDVKGYYYHLLRRMESIRLTVKPDGGIEFFGMRPSEKARLGDLFAAVEDNKDVRNALAGAMAGSLKGSVCFTSSRPDGKKDPKGFAEWHPGKVREVFPPGTPGSFRGAGLLLVATGAELCYAEALTGNAIYATIDSVALRGGVPVVWPSLGLPVEVKAEGSAEFCHRGSYRVGQKQTVNYVNGDRAYESSERKPVPMLYSKQWL